MTKIKVLPLAALLLTASFAGPAAADRIAGPEAKPAPGTFAKPPADPPAIAPVELRPRPRRTPEFVIRQMVMKRRQLQIERLRAYRMRGLFPRNTYMNKTLRVLVDKDGRFCAVANLIALDGQRLLVLKTAKTNRFVNFASLTGGPLVNWVSTSGFTKAEIAAIQLPDSRIGMRLPRPGKKLPPQIVTVLSERQRLTLHLFNVEKLLLKQNAKSINTIVAGIMSNRALLGQLLNSMQYQNKQPI